MISSDVFYNSFAPPIKRVLLETRPSGWVEALKHDSIHLVKLYKETLAAGMKGIAEEAYIQLSKMKLPLVDRARVLVLHAGLPAETPMSSGPAENYIPLPPERPHSHEKILFDHLAVTIARISKKVFLVHPNDGEIFRNDKGKLPQQPYGYYREYVHAQDDIEEPGVCRVIVGACGELFYSSDHYLSFV